MDQDLVLRGEGGGGVLEHHHPGVEAALRSEERRQASVERAPSTSSAIRRSLIAPELGDAPAREVERQCDRLAVEVAAGDHEPAAGRRRGTGVGDPAARGKMSGLSVAAFISTSSTRRR